MQHEVGIRSLPDDLESLENHSQKNPRQDISESLKKKQELPANFGSPC